MFSEYTNQRGEFSGMRFDFHFDVTVFDAISPVIQIISEEMDANIGSISANLDQSARIEKQASRISALLRGTKAEIQSDAKSNDVLFGNLQFALRQNPKVLELAFATPSKAPSSAEFFDLFQILLERGVIYETRPHELF